MNMKVQCTYFCGPYKDFCGRAEYDDDAGIFHGDVVGTQDVVTFQGKTLPELKKAFCASVDDYLAFCKGLGQEPEKPFSGKFVTRLPPELHKKITMMAEAAGMSLNQFVCQCLERMANEGLALMKHPTLESVGGWIGLGGAVGLAAGAAVSSPALMVGAVVAGGAGLATTWYAHRDDEVLDEDECTIAQSGKVIYPKAQQPPRKRKQKRRQ